MSGAVGSASDEESVVQPGRESASDERCGHVYEASTVTGLGGVCCWRPVWGDNDRCIWHADVPQKPTRLLEEAAPHIGERLDGAIFRDVELSGSDWLAGRTIAGARFVNANLDHANLDEADLRYTHFEGVDAKDASLWGTNLEHAEFHRTDLRGADLCRTRLHYAAFDNVRISETTAFGDNVIYEERIDEIDDPDERLGQYEAADWTYSELRRLTADNGLAEASREYYIKRKDIQRRETWEFGSNSRALAKELWRLTTNYGSSPWRVMATALFVILASAILYPLTGGLIESTNGTTITYRVNDVSANRIPILIFVYFLRSLYFSVVTFTTLGYGDIQPALGWARAIAGVEALLGQLLMALFVFVLTRSVTWAE